VRAAGPVEHMAAPGMRPRSLPHAEPCLGGGAAALPQARVAQAKRHVRKGSALWAFELSTQQSMLARGIELGVVCAAGPSHLKLLR